MPGRETAEQPNAEEGLTAPRQRACVRFRRRAWPRRGCAAPRQSPIDLRSNRITFVGRLPRIGFRYPRRVDVTLVNTGSPDEFATVRAELPAGAAHIVLDGVRWDLAQFHWHTPSEHEIEGRSKPPRPQGPERREAAPTAVTRGSVTVS